MLSGLNAGNQGTDASSAIRRGRAASMLSGLNAGNQAEAPVASAAEAACFNAVRLERRKSGGAPGDSMHTFSMASMLSGLNAGNQDMSATLVDSSAHASMLSGLNAGNQVQRAIKRSAFCSASMLSGLNAGNQGT